MELDNTKTDLRKLFEEFVDECKYSRGLRLPTINAYIAVFSHFSKIMPEIDKVEILTRPMLNEFFKRIKTRTRIVGRNTPKVGLEDSTVKTYSRKLNAFFVWLVQRKLMIENPLNGITLKNPEYKDQRALTDEEVRKILTAVNMYSKNSLFLRRDTVMLYLLFFCGLRAGEFISLRVIDIDMEKRILTVRAETSKSKKTRYLTMHPTLIFHLREYINERNKLGYKTEHLFVSTSGDRGLTRHGLKHWVKRLIKLSGVKFHLHRFRHSFACNLAKNNTPIVMIQKLMGHSDIKMTMSYLRSITCEDATAYMDRLSI
ncbi:MAG TPA: site-specific integrase [Candidatus Paceibacterota bacterium]|jgi:integrase|nr:site-specific integrase [Candidatus Paceibacterota bacterium]